MARNRKRAKERRARRTGSGPGRPGVATAGVEDAAPDPIEHATPDVELAEAQLAVGRAQPDEEPEADREPDAPEPEPEPLADELDDAAADELEPEDDGADGGGPPARTAVAATGPGAAPEAHAHPRGRLIGFLQGSWRELQRVQWPDRRQVGQATGVVIGFVIVAGVFLGVSDLLAGHVVTYILNGHW